MKSSAKQIDVLSKLHHLENLIHSLKSESTVSGSQSPKDSSSAKSTRESVSTEVDGLSSTFGRLSFDYKRPSYVGSDHWAAIIEGITELKTQFQDTQQPHLITDRTPNICSEDGPEIFHGHVRGVSREEIIASLPSKDVVDVLVSTYFSHRENVPIFLHQATFLKEYQKFWHDVNSMPITWVGLLYCIMFFAARYQSSFESRGFGSAGELLMTQSVWQIQEYREKVVQCLYAGSYIVPGQYTVETLLMYFMTEHHHHTDSQFGNWILMGEITRIAMRLGLHRDPSHTAKISPFNGEMRRRLWLAIVQCDLTTSIQMGLPRMLRERSYDTHEPLNLLDSDLVDEMAELPASRPDSVITPVFYVTNRGKLLSVFAKISDMMTCVRPISYAEVWELDNELCHARSNLPASLKFRSPSVYPPEGHEVWYYRLSIDAVYQHARCTLHRPYLIRARTNARCIPSRKACIEAALALLSYQETVMMETMPGGHYELFRWKVSSFWNEGMLLAVTVLCIDLNTDVDDGLISDGYWAQGDRSIIAEALRAAQRILLQSWNISANARKAATAIEVVLSKAGLTTEQSVASEAVLGQQAPQYLTQNASPWSLEEFLSPEFPEFQSWNESL
ncbi:hypothetical protein, variant [Verruconis gallopava]|uniref:Xylanolytic transcriptional activator regulatory domain-containing protein n=1 Tax=Verruconis gallopava TaxID=253628 RepID=A0A0D2AE92_9PEZI|nr:hypothetical protein, variant [Verruconis gallopava]KIW05313.1 hypothetical protein, variant [Verruconis gallopava]